ncbi:hypothetical protein GN956_G9605 [Arapaima gigas]
MNPGLGKRASEQRFQIARSAEPLDDLAVEAGVDFRVGLVRDRGRIESPRRDTAAKVSLWNVTLIRSKPEGGTAESAGGSRAAGRASSSRGVRPS